MYKNFRLIGMTLLALSLFVAGCGAPSAQTQVVEVEPTIPSTTEAVADDPMAMYLPEAVSGDIITAGSSTVFPLSERMKQRFEEEGFAGNLTIDSIGSGAGIERFCVAGETDIANASRKIRPSEIADCAKAGVDDIMEVKFGYDGIVLAVDARAGQWKLEPKDLFLALAAQVPKDGALVANPHKTWKEVNADLPDWPILAFIPGEKHGTREVFEEKVMHAGCKATGADALLLAKAEGADETARKTAADKACGRVRKDGAAVDIDGDYTEILARIESNRQALGVFGLSFYENNKDKLTVATISGVEPSLETIASGEYPISRPLFFYVKKAHLGVIPGLKEYVAFFTSDKILSADGPLVEYGLVPLPDAERIEVQELVKSGRTLTTAGK